jgi:phytol kinase
MLQKLFNQFLPDSNIILRLTLPVILLAIVAAFLAGWMKVKKNVRTPYTRKTFHFIIFSAAGVIQYFYGLHAVSLMGMIVSLIVLTGVIAGERIWLYKALARETDAPHQKKFILLPLIATALGGILSNIFFPVTAYIGYFVGGWGDAVGEPVGTRWGKHRYTVPTLFGVKATRSIEGSFAVMLVSIFISFICLINISSFGLGYVLLASLVCGIAAACVEAISSHGLDNLTIQLCASGVLSLFLHVFH